MTNDYFGTATTANDGTTPATPSKRTLRSASSLKKAYAEDASDDAPSTPPAKKARRAKLVPATPNVAPELTSSNIVPPPLAVGEVDADEYVIRPELSFSYEDARKHLCSVDPRFTPLFDTLPCKPFTEEADLNPFRALCCSILGQQVSLVLYFPVQPDNVTQISWLAARAITHKFIRLVAFPELPEKPAPIGMTNLFPTARQVASAPVATLRAAGLSQRKAEYVQDLALRFSDGRLSARALMLMSDDEVMAALTAVRGIGRWTVEMFMIFTLRRPNVLPCGDLGVQKGLIRWLTQVNPGILAKKLPETPAPSTPSGGEAPQAPAVVPLSSLGESQVKSESDMQPPSTPKQGNIEIPLMTPRTESTAELPPLPEGASLTRVALKGRLIKKVKLVHCTRGSQAVADVFDLRRGNIYLTPTEMEELTIDWAPYRSIGVWYLWSLSDADTSFG